MNRTVDRPLRVSVVSAAREVWGSEVSILQLQPELAKCGVDLTIVAPVDGEFAQLADDHGVPVRHLDLHHGGLVNAVPTRRSTVANGMREIPRTFRGSAAVIRATEGADLIHSNSLLTNFDCALAGRLARRPTVLEIHDLVRPGTSRSMLSACVRLSDAAIAISTPVAANVQAWARDQVHLVPQAVDLERFCVGAGDIGVRHELTGYPQFPLIAIVGRLDRVKGAHRVVEAVDELNRSGLECTLVVVGTATVGNESYAEDTAEDAFRRLGDRVRFVGMRGDIPRVLRAVDLLVNASDAEPFGLSVLEAQACLVPVVATNRGGVLDFVEDHRTGRLFDLAKPGDLTQVLADLLADPATAHRFAVAANEQAHERYSLPARAEAVVALYHRLTGRPSRPLMTAGVSAGQPAERWERQTR